MVFRMQTKTSFPEWQFIAVDMKERCIELLEQRAAAAGLSNLKGEVGMAAECPSSTKFDVAIALHACGSATDASAK